MLSKENIKELVVMQDTLNKKTAGVDWATKGYDWKLYAIMECAEAIESMPYKHWKHQEPNLQNVEVELADMLHFVLSDTLVNERSYDVITADISRAQNEVYKDDYIKEVALDVVITSSLKLTLKELVAPTGSSSTLFMLLLMTWQLLGKSPESLYKSYMVKNVLNTFRQDNGYKDGSYKKLWVSDGAEVEDNVVAWKIAEELEVNDTFIVALKKALANKYKDV